MIPPELAREIKASNDAILASRRSALAGCQDDEPASQDRPTGETQPASRCQDARFEVLAMNTLYKIVIQHAARSPFCHCGEEPYTDGETCPTCLAIYCLERTRNPDNTAQLGGANCSEQPANGRN